MKRQNKRGNRRVRPGEYTNLNFWGGSGGALPPTNFNLMPAPNQNYTSILCQYSPNLSTPVPEIGGGAATTGLAISGGNLVVRVLPAVSTSATVVIPCNINVALYKAYWDQGATPPGFGRRSILDPGEVSSRDYYYLESRCCVFSYTSTASGTFWTLDPQSIFRMKVPKLEIESGEALIVEVGYGSQVGSPQLFYTINGRLKTLHFD